MASKNKANATIENDRLFNVKHLMADLPQRTVRNTAVTIVTQAIKFSIYMISTMVLARLLRPADFGLIAMATVVTGFAAMLKDSIFSMAIVQQKDITHEQVSMLFWINLCVSVLILLVISASAPLVALVYDQPPLTWVIIAIAIAHALGSLAAQHQALLRRQMEFGKIAAIDISAMALSVVCGVLFAFLVRSYWALVTIPIVSTAVSAAGYWVISGWRPSFTREFRGVHDLVKKGGDITGFNIANYLSRNADNLLIGYLVGAAQLGMYTKAYGLLLHPIRQISNPITSAVAPTLCRSSHDNEKFRAYFIRSNYMIAAIITPIMSIFFIMPDAIITVILGDQWIDAAPLLMVFAVVGLTQPLTYSFGDIFIAVDKTRVLLFVGVVNACLLVTASAIGCFADGIQGVAFAYAISWYGAIFPILLTALIATTPITAIDILKSCIVPVGTCIVVTAIFLASDLRGMSINPAVKLAVFAIIGRACTCKSWMPHTRIIDLKRRGILSTCENL